MAIAETARLATVLTLDDKLSPGLAKPVAAVKKFEGSASRAGTHVASLGKTMAKTGVIAGGALAGGLLLAVRSGLGDLATLETATTSVTGAIKRMGLAGQVTADQVATWANEIEASVGAAFDDKDIVAGTASLIRYGHVAKANIRPAMVVMTDLAVKTGSVSAASKLLGKALADPVKGMTALRRVGVILTAEQEKQITSLYKVTGKQRDALKGMSEAEQKVWLKRHAANAQIKAQALLLKDLAKVTKGAADASQGPYARSLSLLADASEDAKKALAEGFLPVIERVAGKLSKVLADPKAIQSIRDLGTGLANAFDDAVDFAEKIPWGTIADGLKSAAAWSKQLFDVFRSLPPEVQTTLVALAGLNKLSGGAVTGIVSELGKGLIKGVLGMTAGVVNIKAATVTGVGGGPGGILDDGKPTSKVGKVLDVASKLLVVGAAAEIASAFAPVITQAGVDLHNALNLPKLNLPIPQEWPWGPKNTPTILPDIFGGNGLLGGSAPAPSNPQTSGDLGRHGPMPVVDKQTTARIAHLASLEQRLQSAKDAHDGSRAHRLQAKIDALKAKMGMDDAGIKAKQQASIVAFRAGERATHAVGTKVQRSTAAMNDVRHAVNTVRNTTSSKLGAANSKLDAIRHKKMSFKTSVHVNASTTVSVRNVNNSNKTTNRYSSKTLNQVL